jgi:hypothetical protein
VVRHQSDTMLVMGSRTSRRRASTASTARTIRFPESLRVRLAADAERCGRSFEAQVIAILRSHFGEHVDIAPPAEQILAALRRSAEGISDSDWNELTARDDDR